MSTAFFNAKAVLGSGPYATTLEAFGGPSPFGTIYFVNSLTGSINNAGNSPSAPFATLAYVVANKAAAGDTIVLAPGFTETLSAAQTLSLAGLAIIGIGAGALKPTLTVAGAVDGLNITGANIVVANVAFAAPTTDEATSMINVAAAGVQLLNISGIGSASSKNFVDCITIAAGADDLLIQGLELYNSNTAVNSFISIEAAVNRLKIFDSFCFGDVVAGGLIDSAKALQIHLRNLVIAVVGTTKPAATLDSNPTGLAENCKFSGTDTTLANNGALGNLMRLFNVWLLEETDNSKQGVQIPAVDVD